jgi:hypothetical protein
MSVNLQPRVDAAEAVRIEETCIEGFWCCTKGVGTYIHGVDRMLNIFAEVIEP